MTASRLLVGGGASLFGLRAMRRRWSEQSSVSTSADSDSGHINNELALCRAELADARSELARLRAGDQQQLAGRMNKAVEDERSRLASDLHNRPLQELAGVGYQLERVSMALGRGDTEAADALVNEASDQLTSQLEALRMLMTDLRSPPLEQGGLAGALAGLKARFLHDSPGIDLTLDGLDTEMAVEAETVFYRVAQESLNNVARHAEALSVRIVVSGDATQIEMTVQDDGTGFDVNAFTTSRTSHHQGIDAMRARVAMIGGTFAITSTEHGTTVHCAVPRSFDRTTLDTKEPPQ